jgi:outer membrane protein assembly factor BamB
LWQNTQLKSRDVSAPAIVGGAVVVGDFQGYVHFLSRDNGAFVARVKTGAPITAQPVLAGNVLVVQNRAGKLYGFRPQ